MRRCDKSRDPEARQVHLHVAFIWFVGLDECDDSEDVSLVNERHDEKEYQGGNVPDRRSRLGLTCLLHF